MPPQLSGTMTAGRRLATEGAQGVGTAARAAARIALCCAAAARPGTGGAARGAPTRITPRAPTCFSASLSPITCSEGSGIFPPHAASAATWSACRLCAWAQSHVPTKHHCLSRHASLVPVRPARKLAELLNACQSAPWLRERVLRPRACAAAGRVRACRLVARPSRGCTRRGWCVHPAHRHAADEDYEPQRRHRGQLRLLAGALESRQRAGKDGALLRECAPPVSSGEATGS